MNNDALRWSDLLGLRKMVAPKLILLLYWMGGASIVVVGTGRMFGAFGARGVSGIGDFVGSLLAIALIFLVWRILCELWILLFSIHDRLGALLDATRKND